MSISVMIRLLGPEDAKILDSLAPGVFDNPIDPRWREEFLKDPRHHLVVALVDELVVGMASGVHYVHPDKSPQFWVNEVGVAPNYQRQGIGRQLLQALFNHARSLGCQEAWLGTEVDNMAARKCYTALGGTEETIVYVTFQLETKTSCEVN